MKKEKATKERTTGDVKVILPTAGMNDVVEKVAKVIDDAVKKVEDKKEIPEGLNQTFSTKLGNRVSLSYVLEEKDWWTTTGKKKLTMVTHAGVQKIADFAEVGRDPQYTILTQPDAYNNYQYTIQCRICRGSECATEIGEANRNNLGSKGRGNPANMAQKRAYDRAVFRLLGITGLLSEEELSDNDEAEKQMDNLSHDERKAIAPLLNKILTAKTKAHMAEFNVEMKKILSDPLESTKINEVQISYIRELFKKKVAELSKTSF